MPVITCPKSRCTWKTDDLGEATAMRLIELHLGAEHEMDVKDKKEGHAKVERVRRPEVTPDMSEERWAYFLNRWEAYKKGCGLKEEGAMDQLVECLAEPVREDHYRQFAGVKAKNEKDLLLQIHQVTVRKANRAVVREKIGGLKQDRGESIRKFAGRLRALAMVSGFEVTCDCGKKVSYMQEYLKDKIVAGLNDGEIKTAVLGHRDVNTWSMDELLLYIEAKEAGKVSVSMMGGTASAAAVSTPAAAAAVSGGAPRSGTRDKPKEKCDKCGRSHGGDRTCPAKELKCYNCEKIGHLASKCRQPKVKRKDHAKAVDAKAVDAKDEKEESVGAVGDTHCIC